MTHAAGESSPGGLSPGTNAVVLAARSEDELRELAQKLSSAAVPHVVIDEPDAPWNGALMAIGIAPAPRKEVRKHVSSLPLLR